MAEIIQLPENSGAGMGNIPFSIPIGGGNGGGLFGNGQTNLTDLFGFAIIASMFPNLFGQNGRGGYGGPNGGGLNSDLTTQAVIAQGEASRTAIQTLASSVGQDFNIVYGAVANVQNALNSLASANGMGFLQVINALQSGDANLASQFQQCCCQNRLETVQQTNALQRDINGVQQSIAAKSAADQLAICQQTYALTDTMNRNYLALDNKIDALESNRKDREITALTAKVAQLESQSYTAGVVQQAVAPVIGQLNALGQEVAAIKRCQPATITLPNNQYTAVPTLVANAGADFVASYWANRLSQATTGTTGTTTE